MISVQNRLPEPGKENRVSITPDNGSAVEGVLAYADDATQEGTFWNRKTAQLLQGDIRTYPVRAGQSISAGDVVNVGRELLSGTEQTYGDLPVGSTVQINENGSPVDYLVVHQGKPSDMYDDSCDGTWMLRKDIAEKRAWDSGDSTVLESSDIQAYLNGDWMNRYDNDTMGKIKMAKIPYRQNGGYNGTDRNGANGLSCRIFLLSGREVGWDSSDNSYFPNDGAKLGYFIDGTTSSANNKRIANLNGSATDWWLRSPSTGHTNYVWYVNSDGDDNGGIASYSWGVRPAFIVDSSALTGDKPVYGPETVYKDVVAQDNVENVIASVQVTNTDIVKLSDTESAIAFSTHENNWSYAKFAIIDNTGKIKSSIKQLDGVHAYGYMKPSINRIDDTHCSYVYNANGNMRGYIVSNDLSLSSQFSIVSGYGTNYFDSIFLDSSILFFVYDNNGIKSKTFEISQNTIVENNMVYSLPGNTGANYISACRLPDEGGNKRVCICFSDTGDSNKGKAVIATVDSSNAVTFGDVVTPYDISGGYISSCGYSNNLIWMLYNNKHICVTDDQLNLLDNKAFDENAVSDYERGRIVAEENIDGIVVLFSAANENKAGCMISQFVSNQITFSDAFYYNSTGKSNYVSSDFVANDKFIVAYADSGNSNYGTTTILTVEGNQIAGSFLDESKDAIALADGTGGQSIPVGFGGYCECPGVTEGDTIESSGVWAFSPLDGWLMISYAQEKQYVVGEYTGTGTFGESNPTVIDVGFTPKCVIIQSSPYSALFVYNDEKGTYLYSPDQSRITKCTWTKTGISFYAKDRFIQCNVKSRVYHYIAWR